MWALPINRFEKLNFFFSLATLERCFSQLSYCSHERQTACATQPRESNGSPQGKSNNSLLVVSLRQMLAIATLATEQEQFPDSDAIL